MYDRFKDQVEFVAIYIREAHPTDGWQMASNDAFGIKFSQPKSFDERIGIATKCKASIDFAMPLVVDKIDNRTENAYSAFPDRLYIVDIDGKVAFKGGRGPFGYQPEMLEQSVVMMLLDLNERKKLAKRAVEIPPDPKTPKPSN